MILLQLPLGARLAHFASLHRSQVLFLLLLLLLASPSLDLAFLLLLLPLTTTPHTHLLLQLQQRRLHLLVALLLRFFLHGLQGRQLRLLAELLVQVHLHNTAQLLGEALNDALLLATHTLSLLRLRLSLSFLLYPSLTPHNTTLLLLPRNALLFETLRLSLSLLLSSLRFFFSLRLTPRTLHHLLLLAQTLLLSLVRRHARVRLVRALHQQLHLLHTGRHPTPTHSLLQTQLAAVRLVHLVHPTLLTTRLCFLRVTEERSGNLGVVFVVGAVDTPRLELAPESVECIDLLPGGVDGSKERSERQEGKQHQHRLDLAEAAPIDERARKAVEEVLSEHDGRYGQIDVGGVVSVALDAESTPTLFSFRDCRAHRTRPERARRFDGLLAWDW